MRLRAHATPSKEVYTTMISVCADARDPQPERARDLWMEMTTEGDKIQPTRREYDAIIRALGSTKADYLEAFDLFRQMLSQHHAAVLVPFEEQPRKLLSAYVPTLETFTALMEGTKRAGDIERARWILSELVGLVRSSIQLGQPMDGPDEELLSGIFMTYAAWKPKLSRRTFKLRDEGKLSEEALQEVEADEEAGLGLDAANLEDLTAGSGVVADHHQPAARRHTSPKSSSEALREAEAIFERILFDAAARKAGDENGIAHPFTDVKLRTRLVNSYLSVHLEHAPNVAAAKRAWDETWARVQQIEPSAKPNGWSYVLLLDRCASAKRKGETADDKANMVRWGKMVWKEYLAWSASAPLASTAELDSSTTAIAPHTPGMAADKRLIWLAGLAAREVEKCWKAAIKLYAMTDHTMEGMKILEDFHKTYPSADITRTYTPLTDAGVESRMTDFTALVEPDVPPHLVFQDLDVLHQRLVRKEDFAGVGFVKRIASEYEAALFKRRKFRRKNIGVERERQRTKQAEHKMRQQGSSRARMAPPVAEEPAIAEEASWEGIESPPSPSQQARRRSWKDILNEGSVE